MVMLMEWTGRPLQPRRKPPDCHAHQTDSPTLSHGCQRSHVEFFALPPLLFALKAERLFLVSANSDKTPHHTHLQHAKSSQNHRDDWPPFLLTASCESPSPTPTAHFQLKLKKPIRLLYTSGSRGVVKRHNHFKIGTNDPELLHYRSGKSKFIFVNVQNPCLQPP